jgi:hypothetical protein
VQLTSLPQTGLEMNWSSITLLSALALVVAVVALMAGSRAATAVPRKTARTSPLTERNAAFGLSASRRAAKIGAAPPPSFGSSLAACAVSHGPPITSPIMMTSSPGRAGAPIDWGVVSRIPATKSAMPASSGTIRQVLGGGGVTRLLTPSGVIRTRRNAIREAMAAAAGTATSTPRYPHSVGVTSLRKYTALVTADLASGGWMSSKMPIPTRAPSSAPTTDSTDAMTLMSRAVAPTSRSDA